ncbi:hypothetical protein [Fredinandcohnia sp. 179-A 10B2 NHS]|uniref:hypothetical protein n=1 Tax=Fredinandcohnia sp. 179-A 10B2 NHS TaxID=3235176 RepID=UPI00399F4AFC
MTREELMKRTVKDLKAYYEELTGVPYSRSIKKKEQLVGDIKMYMRACQRGKAFSQM